MVMGMGGISIRTIFMMVLCRCRENLLLSTETHNHCFNRLFEVGVVLAHRVSIEWTPIGSLQTWFRRRRTPPHQKTEVAPNVSIDNGRTHGLTVALCHQHVAASFLSIIPTFSLSTLVQGYISWSCTMQL